MSETQTQNDPFRQKVQMAFVIVLVTMAITLPLLYVYHVGIATEDDFIKNVLIGSWTLVVAGIGMAFSQIGLGRKVS